MDDDDDRKMTIGNYEAILDCCKTVSMTLLDEFCGTGFGHEIEKKAIEINFKKC